MDNYTTSIPDEFENGISSDDLELEIHPVVKEKSKEQNIPETYCEPWCHRYWERRCADFFMEHIGRLPMKIS